MVYVDVADECKPSIVAMCNAIRDAFAQHDMLFDTKPFHPHMTTMKLSKGRNKGIAGGDTFQQARVR